MTFLDLLKWLWTLHPQSILDLRGCRIFVVLVLLIGGISLCGLMQGIGQVTSYDLGPPWWTNPLIWGVALATGIIFGLGLMTAAQLVALFVWDIKNWIRSH